MARYITTLQERNAELERRLAAMEEKIRDFRGHLLLPKFQGDGNDYIQVRDVDARLVEILTVE